ncbi:MAG: adenylate kinase [Sphingobacteriales bacterium]|jgi:adenylate kinase
MLNIVLFGPPGAGKGTQSKLILEKYQLVHLSTGDILRGEIKNATTLGLEAKKLMDQGELVPDEIVIGMINNKLDDNKGVNGFVFDGFPRTVAQAEALDNLLSDRKDSISGMVALEVSDKELVKRLLKRGVNEGRTDDASEEVIQNRINTYNNKTKPVSDFYKKQNKFHSINGEGGIEDIRTNLCATIDGLK